MGAALIHINRRTDATNLIGTFLDYPNAPKNSTNTCASLTPTVNILSSTEKYTESYFCNLEFTDCYFKDKKLIKYFEQNF